MPASTDIRRSECLGHGIIATLIEKATIETAGQAVHLRSSSPVDLAEAGRILSSFFGASTRRSTDHQSVNNLKQIGLAFHNLRGCQ